ncbi:MAG: exodeoxyribonuclease VII small subunit [Bacteroidaceae bacterium]|nr:exodeoxyribonuclease VII small subunit [Bacteroidaceae bacterium]
MKEKMTYEAAVNKLEEIVQKMENNEYSMDELTTQLKEAKKMISFCQQKLNKVDEEVASLLNETAV